MKKQLYLQMKRGAKLFPFLLAITVLLVFGLTLALRGLMVNNSQKTENLKFNIGVAGDIHDPLLQMGLGAFKVFDETRFSLEMVQMEENEAHSALEKGQIAAYVVLPENFVQNALNGVVEPIKFATTTDSTDLVTMFKNEITRVITNIVIASQKGTYGIGDVLSENGYGDISNHHINEISIHYFDLVLNRNETLYVEELGVSSGLGLVEYYVCNVVILFVMLSGIPFVCLYCQRDRSLSVLMLSKGYSHITQLLSEFFAHLVSLLALLAIVLGGVAVTISTFDAQGLPEIFSRPPACPFLYILPVVLTFAAFNMMLFELFSTVISGLLFHSFCTISLAYISGFFYPLYSFPKIIQDFSIVLPTRVAREYLATFFTGEPWLLKTILLLLYMCLFLAVALFIKRFKTARHTGGGS